VKYQQGLPVFISFLLFVLAGSARVTSDELLHVVGKGETIYSISRSYSVSAEDLIKANNISDPTKLMAGSTLRIPLPVRSSVQNTGDYRVVKGDTLYSIARNNGITLQALLDINKFSSSGHVLKTGDIVKVPVRETQASNIYALRWPVAPKDISYMTGQMGVVVEGEYTESVKSLTQGRVISAGPWRKFGRVVIVETDGGYFYMYGGCESLSVKVGDRIMPGMEVGKLGISVVTEKPQLFFMVFRSDVPIDPALAPRIGISAENEIKKIAGFNV